MSVRFSKLHCKEVILVNSGQRLGFVSDALVEVPEGNITAILVPGPCRFLGLGGRQEDYLIPWCKICRIGPDIILVDADPEKCRIPRMGKPKSCERP